MKSYNGFTPAQRAASIPIQKRAVEAGLLPKDPPCEMCGLQGRGACVAFHLEDYNRPVEDARPLCVQCHMALHMRFRFPNRWRRHCLFVRAGGQPKAWRSYREFVRANPFPRKDVEPIELIPEPSRWWEMLSLTPVPEP